MGPGERAVVPERAPQPPGPALLELRALTRGAQSLAETRWDPSCARNQARALQPAACFAPCGSAGPHPVKLTPTDS